MGASILVNQIRNLEGNAQLPQSCLNRAYLAQHDGKRYNIIYESPNHPKRCSLRNMRAFIAVTICAALCASSLASQPDASKGDAVTTKTGHGNSDSEQKWMQWGDSMVLNTEPSKSGRVNEDAKESPGNDGDNGSNDMKKWMSWGNAFVLKRDEQNSDEKWMQWGKGMVIKRRSVA